MSLLGSKSVLYFVIFLDLIVPGFSEVQVYRYVDDNENLISHDDYYASFPPSFFAKIPTTTRKPFPLSTRYPVYIRPDYTTSAKSTTTTTTQIPEIKDIRFRTEKPVSTSIPTTSLPPTKATTTTPEPTRSTTTAQTRKTTPSILLSASSNLHFQNEMQLEIPTAEVFLTRGNTEETTPLGLSTESIKDIQISPEMVRSGSDFNHVVLLCNASYPVEWLYEGLGAPMLYTTQIRTFVNFFDKSTYGYISIVVLVQERLDERQTGTYICKRIGQSKSQIGFHLYFNGEFGFPNLQNVVIQPESNDTTVLIPCPTTDPTATIGLYKIQLPNESRNLRLHGHFEYDPRKGFWLKLSDMSSPFGTYMCKFNDAESDWKIDVVRPKNDEVQIFPNATVMKMDNLADHSFMCKAREPVQIMLPNTVDLGIVEYKENPRDQFPFLAKLTITPSVPLFSIANYFKVNCQSRKNRRILHTWEYSNFGEEEIKVTYDAHHKRLMCCAKSQLTPIHEMAKCDTVTDCNIKKNCFASGRCDYAFPPKFVDAPRGCTAIEFMNDFPSHVMRCKVGENSKTLLVTSNIANDNLIIYDGRVPDTQDILKLVTLKPQRNNRVAVRCVASIFYFSTNLVFAFEQEDGTLKFANEHEIESINSYGPTLRTKLEPGTKKIFCFAPLTRQDGEWRNASVSVSTSEFPPEPLPLNQQPEVEQTSYPDINSSSEENFDAQRIVTSVKSSTSVSTFLKKRKGQLIKVMQYI